MTRLNGGTGNSTGILSGLFTSITDGNKIVTTAGTRVQLSSSSIPCQKVIVIAMTNNTNIVTVGGSDVVAALATRKGVPLYAGDSYDLYVSNLYLVYIDSLVNGEGVTYIY